MNEYDIKRLARVLAVQAEIEGMKSENTNRIYLGEVHGVKYFDEDFKLKAEELRNLAAMHNDQL